MQQSDNQQQIRELYERYASLVHSRCRYLLKSDQEAWDATQEVFIKLMRALPTIEKKDSMHSWLLRTSTNHCISQLRKKKGVEFQEEFHTGENTSQSPEKRAVLRDIVNRLMGPWDAKTREIVVYAYVDGYKQEEIAKVMKMGESTVRKYLTRFRKKSMQWKNRHEATG